MKKILIWFLILGSPLAYGKGSGGFLRERRQERVFFDIDRDGSYGREFQYLAGEIGGSNNQNKFELNGYTSGFSYGYEWSNRISLELGVKVYVAEEDLEEEEYLQEEAWQHSLYASIGYRF